jgi:hypothetical protein
MRLILDWECRTDIRTIMSNKQERWEDGPSENFIRAKMGIKSTSKHPHPLSRAGRMPGWDKGGGNEN